MTIQQHSSFVQPSIQQASRLALEKLLLSIGNAHKQKTEGRINKTCLSFALHLYRTLSHFTSIALTQLWQKYLLQWKSTVEVYNTGYISRTNVFNIQWHYFMPKVNKSNSEKNRWAMWFLHENPWHFNLATGIAESCRSHINVFNLFFVTF